MEWKLTDDRPIWSSCRTWWRRRSLPGCTGRESGSPSVRELAAEAGVNPNTSRGPWQTWRAGGWLWPTEQREGV